MIQVSLSDLFYFYGPKHNQSSFFAFSLISREERINALKKDAAEMVATYGLEDQIETMGITLEQIAIDYLDRN